TRRAFDIEKVGECVEDERGYGKNSGSEHARAEESLAQVGASAKAAASRRTRRARASSLLRPATGGASPRDRAIQCWRVFRAARNARAVVAGYRLAGAPSLSRHPPGRRRVSSLASRELPRRVSASRRGPRASPPVRTELSDHRCRS